MKLVDPGRTGLARYCPTFVAAFERLSGGITRSAASRKERSRLCGYLRQGKAEPLVEAIAADTSKAALVGRFLFHRDRNTMILACAALRWASQRGADISPAVPHLAKAFRHHDFFMRLQAMNTVCDSLPSLSRPARLQAIAAAESFVNEELDEAVIADPGGSPMVFESLLRLMRSISALEGSYPLCTGKLIAELRAHPKAGGGRRLGG